MKCGEALCRTLMFTFNAIFWACGLIVMAVAIWVAIDTGNALSKFKEECLKTCEPTASNDQNCIDSCEKGIPIEDVQAVAYILIALGGLMTLFGFIGCCGALRHSACLLWTFFGCVLITFLGLIGCGIAVLVIYGTDIDKVFWEFLNQSPDLLKATEAVYDCCSIPVSLEVDTVDGCQNLKDDGIRCVCSPEKGNCLAAMTSFFTQYSTGIGVCGLLVGLTMIFGMLVSCWLAKRTGSEHNELYMAAQQSG